MGKPKKNTGNKDANLPPVDDFMPKYKGRGGLSGSNESEGGSRQGNAGHERTPASDEGSRQVKF